MKDARFFLVVRFSIDAAAERQVLGWLDGGHVAEVLRQPGFLSCPRLRHGIESRAAFEKYEASTGLKAKFARERFAGELEKTYAA